MSCFSLDGEMLQGILPVLHIASQRTVSGLLRHPIRFATSSYRNYQQTKLEPVSSLEHVLTVNLC